MWIDTQTGTIRIADDLTIQQHYSFDEFRNTRYYSGQDKDMFIDLEQPVIIENVEFYVRVIFSKGIIYSISLVQNDDNISFENEIERKQLHDLFLQRNGIEQREYTWGKIISDYDRRGNMSSIGIYYKPIKMSQCNVMKEMMMEYIEMIEAMLGKNDVSPRLEEYIRLLKRVLSDSEKGQLKPSNGRRLGIARGISDFNYLASNRELWDLANRIDDYYEIECKEI